MKKTKIDWCDSTWNPVTGCRHGCEYCYAKRITDRFGKNYMDLSDLAVKEGLHVLDTKFDDTPYPFGFEPTFHAYRLGNYANDKGRNIFVCSMADLFGEWVPSEWISEVFGACKKAPQHNYLFLTKNPHKIPMSSHIYNGTFGQHDNNLWFGTTITNQHDLENRMWPLLQVRGHTFLSIEPLLSCIDLRHISVADKDGAVTLSLQKKMAYYLFGGQSYRMPEWVIIGAETGNRKDKVVPKRRWIEHIVSACKEAKIPVFMKESLSDIWGEPLIQEFPKGLQISTSCSWRR